MMATEMETKIESRLLVGGYEFVAYRQRERGQEFGQLLFLVTKDGFEVLRCREGFASLFAQFAKGAIHQNPLAAFSIGQFLEEFWTWNQNAFGPGPRTQGTLKHMRKELDEIERDPTDVLEWVDMAFLSFNGALRHGHSPAQLEDAIWKKFAVVKTRQWPDWRNTTQDEPIEHVREPVEMPSRDSLPDGFFDPATGE